MVYRLTNLYRYPVKGLSPEPLDQVDLLPGQTLPGDRAYAIENGGGRFDESAPRFLPKTAYFMLARHEQLARLRTHFDVPAHRLDIVSSDGSCTSFDLGRADGRTELSEFIANYLGPAVKGPVRVVHAPGFAFTDEAVKCLSLINLASVRALEARIGKPIDPLRFRGNLYVEGLEPWQDHGWCDRSLRIGSAVCRGYKPIVRCPATNVDPASGTRDLTIPEDLERYFGHRDLGLYLTVEQPGTLRPGDTIELL